MMYKSLTNVNFIDRTQNTSRKDRNYIYSINMEVVNYHSELLNYRPQNKDDYHKDALKIINVQEVDYF